jgi:Mrp family chromosome partitioning ATPase
MTARARNALRRPIFIGTVSILTFATALLALVIVPQQARKAAAAMRPSALARPDTEPTAAALAEAEREVGHADSAIVSARLEVAQLVAASAASATARVASDTSASGAALGSATRRDTLADQAALLGRLIARAENAPLLTSYRALAQAAPMQGEPRVRQLLDSLVEIERERDSYNAVGGVDPVFVALTARANELGRNIQALADTRRAALQAELAQLAPSPRATPVAVAARPVPDTMARIKARDTARVVAAEVATRLARERAELVQLDAREERARELANVGASPSAMLAAALVFGAMIGFGVTLLDEVRHPRIADAHEVERVTDVRVLGTISPLPPSPDRQRRGFDRSGPPYIDPGADGHQLVYLTIATAGTNVVMLSVTGDSAAVSAVVAMNFAATAADEARGTLLIDTDGVASSVTAALRIRGSAGIRGLVNGTADWHEVTRSARLGRERTIDVVPSGESGASPEEIAAVIARDIGALTRRYDAIVIVSTPDQLIGGLAAALPIPDVLFCARVGHTPLEQLKQSLDDLDRAGANIRGIVLWGAPDPIAAEIRPVEETEREMAAAV